METTSIQGFLLIAGVIFGSVSIIHLVRALYAWGFVIGPMNLPIAVSWLGFIVTLSLSAWAFLLLLKLQ